MRYRKLGKWGIKVSEISLGAWTTGALFGAGKTLITSAT
jgi:aryl-alcohol dehydrogenase-like predicted oxidoreductase